MQKHRRLLAWQHCMELAIEVYRVTSRFPSHERYGLTAQLRRAAVSAAANIAEGNARYGPAELAHGLSIALGSLAEVDTLLEVSLATGTLAPTDHDNLSRMRDAASRSSYLLQRATRQAVPR